MNRSFITSFTLVCITLLLVGCATTKSTPTTSEVAKAESPAVNTAIDTPSVQQPQSSVKSKEDEEYERSVNQMTNTVTKEVFSEDKKEILQIIANLDTIMKNYDYASWITYVDEESRIYWENRKNLHKASTRLPVKGLQLDSLEDYFKFVFIQSRIGREVDEIRYLSDMSVKAVQVKDSQDIVYYYFHKVDGTWKLHLPPLDD